MTAVVQGLLGVPIEGSVALFLAGATVHLFATTSTGIFLGREKMLQSGRVSFAQSAVRSALC